MFLCVFGFILSLTCFSLSSLLKSAVMSMSGIRFCINCDIVLFQIISANNCCGLCSAVMSGIWIIVLIKIVLIFIQIATAKPTHWNRVFKSIIHAYFPVLNLPIISTAIISNYVSTWFDLTRTYQKFPVLLFPYSKGEQGRF